MTILPLMPYLTPMLRLLSVSIIGTYP